MERDIRRMFPSVLLMLTLSLDASSQPLPLDTWSTIDGIAITPHELVRQGPTLITFWAIWCAPCKHELRALKELYERYSDRGFSVIAVNQDSPRSLAKVRSYVAANQLPFSIVPDPNKQILEQMNVSSLPHTVLYDTRGNISYTSIGFKPGDEKRLEEEIRRLLGDG